MLATEHDSLSRRGFVQRGWLGQGACGAVYEVEAPGGVPAAVKVIYLGHAEFAGRERRALEAVKRLRHVHLLRVAQFWEDAGSLYVVMDLADRSLRAWAKEGFWGRGLPAPASAICRFVGQVAAAADFLHRHGILHRDIKPDNVLLLGEDALLGDAGLARQWERGMETCAGTPAYMAPECWAGSPAFASDQYALAVSAVELRTGRLPFAGHSWDRLLDAHRYNEPDLGQLGEGQRLVLLRALAKRPEDRFPSCSTFARALRQAHEADAEGAELLDASQASCIVPETTPPPT